MSSPSSRAAGCVAAAVVLVTGLLASVGAAPGAVAADPPCGDATPGLFTHLWTGGSGTWDSASWEDAEGTPVSGPGHAPGSYDTDYVCIDAGTGGVVTIPDGINAVQLRGFVVADGTTLRLVSGKLFVHGDPADRVSVVDGRLELTTSYLGGSGRIRIDGRMRVSTDPGVSTFTSDSCVSGTPPGVFCPGYTSPGELVVAPGAWLDVNGAFGTQLQQGYALTVQGLASLTGSGSFVSADRGTSITVAAGAELLLRNDGGVYEGFDRGLPRRADLTNAGTIRKKGSTGASALDVTYRRVGAGRVVVESGTVTLPGGARGVTVAGGKLFGTGACPAGALQQCSPSFTATDREFGRVQPSARTTVSATEGPVRRRAADFSVPFVYSFGGSARTATVFLYYALPRGAPRAFDVWWSRTRDGRYSRVATSCRRGKIPSGKSTCVIKRVRHSGGARAIVRTRVDGSLVARRR